MLLRQRALPEAAREAAQALTLQPYDPYAHYVRALVSFRLGEMEDAAHHADISGMEKPDFAPAHLLQAQALIGRYRFASSLNDEARENTLARYRSAAEALEVYVKLVPESANRRI